MPIEEKYTVVFHVQEHEMKERKIVWIERSESDTEDEVHRKAVGKAMDRTPYTYEETASTKKKKNQSLS